MPTKLQTSILKSIKSVQGINNPKKTTDEKCIGYHIEKALYHLNKAGQYFKTKHNKVCELYGRGE